MIMALVIALSVALLPTAGSAASIVGSSQDAYRAMAKDMTMASDMSGAMDECCPDQAKDTPCDRTSNHCPMVCCAGQSLNFAVFDAFRFNSPTAAGNLLPIPADQVVDLHSGSPPFRPPRV
jgi:predicted deacylase